MTLLSEIISGTKELHEALEARPFIQRYKTDELKLIDHYRHLSQLLPLYEAFEKKITAVNFSIQFPAEFAHLLKRTDYLRQDIKFLKQYLVHEGRDEILQATTDYANFINSIQDDEELLSHFLVRILGDLFGGQSIKAYVSHLYERTNIDIKKGFDFYIFTPKTLREFSIWMNENDFSSSEKIVHHVNEGFAKLAPIFDELENERIKKLLELRADDSCFKRFHGTYTDIHASFFKAKPSVIVGTAAAVGLCLIAYNCVMP